MVARLAQDKYFFIIAYHPHSKTANGVIVHWGGEEEYRCIASTAKSHCLN
jgi:hypothetical protein